MKKRLVIVESPAKARTLNKYLGKGYQVKASMGHVRDLPKSKLGVDVENNFKPTYVTIKGKEKVLRELKKDAKDTQEIFLASDPDREGEAIAWHVAQALGKKEDRKLKRILFHEITQKAIQEALKHPSPIDTNKVNAQQARRILDRLVGYTLSPLLWRKVERGLSAGRVQSVAVRLICEREEEIEKFVPREYWTITAHLEKKGTPPPFSANLFKVKGKKAELTQEKEVKEVLDNLKGATYKAVKVDKKERRDNPKPPFITSTLQQEAARKLGFTAKKTMLIAQQLYEGMDLGEEGPVGLITYMRTDSVRLSPEAQKKARKVIRELWGAKYLPAKAPQYKSKKSAQEAHEAIRPTEPARRPDSLKGFLPQDHWKLYKLIWDRFMASQMEPALYDVTTVDIQAGEYLFRATGRVLRFPGYTILYTEGKDEKGEEEEPVSLPPLKEKTTLELTKLEPKQHFTQPPPRFTEATLVKTLEEKGIGRPSTYAAILSTIQERGYAEKKQKRLYPTILGRTVNELLVKFFPRILDVDFTARVEEFLDEIEEGKRKWIEPLREFYTPFMEELKVAEDRMERVKKTGKTTDIICEKCGKPMVERWSRHGRFLGCSGYPACKNIIPLNSQGKIMEKEGPDKSHPCPAEGCDGYLVKRRGRGGRFFYGCSNYPKCRFTNNNLEDMEKGIKKKAQSPKTKRT